MIEFILFSITIVAVEIIIFSLFVIFEKQTNTFLYKSKIFSYIVCMGMYWMLCLGTCTVSMSYKNDNDETEYIYFESL